MTLGIIVSLGTISLLIGSVVAARLHYLDFAVPDETDPAAYERTAAKRIEKLRKRALTERPIREPLFIRQCNARRVMDYIARANAVGDETGFEVKHYPEGNFHFLEYTYDHRIPPKENRHAR